MSDFRGGKKPDNSVFAMLNKARVEEAINNQVAARDALIRQEITRLGHDLNSPDPIPEWIIKSISERMALGEFDGPIHVRITDHEEQK